MHIISAAPANSLTPADETAVRAWAAPRRIAVERDQTERGEAFFALMPHDGRTGEALADLHLARHDGRVVAIGMCEEIASGSTVAEALAALGPWLSRWEADLAA